MAIEILSYTTSVLNPFLKLLILVLFIVAAWLFYRCRQRYGGILHQVSTLLLIGAVAGALASAFRFEGDFYVQYKWGESIFNLALVILILVITLIIRAKLEEVTRLFGSPGEDELP
nr:hypothetical protein [uncultured Methanoregula sp.]